MPVKLQVSSLISFGFDVKNDFWAFLLLWEKIQLVFIPQNNDGNYQTEWDEPREPRPIEQGWSKKPRCSIHQRWQKTRTRDADLNQIMAVDMSALGAEMGIFGDEKPGIGSDGFAKT